MGSPLSSCVQCLLPRPVDPVSGKCEVCSGTAVTENTIFGPTDRPAADASSGSFHYSDLPVPDGYESTQDPDPDAAAQATTAAPPRHRTVPRPPTPDGYELIGEIGHGGMGVVYLARESATCEVDDPESGHRVAIKFLMDPSDYAQLDRFRIEIKVLRELEDENFVRVLTANLDAAVPYYVMEIAGGGGLDKLVSVAAPLDPQLSAKWMKCVTEAVAKAHEKKILHRDLKPANILLARFDGNDAAFVRLKSDLRPRASEPFAFADHYPKVADFGLAKRMGRGDGVTVGSAAMGSPPYMSPEQVKNPQGGDPDDRMSHRADVYSLGATLYHLLCGRPPFVGDAIAVTTAVLCDDPPRPRALRPEIPIELEAIVVKAIQKNPRHRYQTAAEMAADLGHFIDKKPELIDAPKQTRARRAWKAVQRNKWVAALFGIGIAIFALGAASGGNAGRGIAPPSAEEVAQRELKAIYAELDEHGHAELIGKGGQLRWHRWAAGRGQLTPSEMRDGTIDFQAHNFAFLEVMPDPRQDRYRVTFTLRHLHGDVRGGTVGVYVGRGSDVSPSGRVVHATVAARYSDEFMWDELKDPKIAQRHGVDLLHMLTVDRPGMAIQNESESNWNRLRFAPHDLEPRLWREVTFDVSPERVELWWGLEGEKAELVGRQTGTSVGTTRVSVSRDIIDAENVPPQFPPWQPRSPLGIWSSGCVVSIKSVKVRAIPDPK